MKCDYMFIQVRYVQLQAHIYKALLNILASDKFDTFSNIFYQHHNFHSPLMSSLGKNDVAYKSIERVVVG